MKIENCSIIERCQVEVETLGSSDLGGWSGFCVQKVNRILALEVEEMHTTKKPKKKKKVNVTLARKR